MIKAWINNKADASWPMVSNGESLWYDGKLVGVTYNGKKHLRKDFAKKNYIAVIDHNEDWGTINEQLTSII